MRYWLLREHQHAMPRCGRASAELRPKRALLVMEGA